MNAHTALGSEEIRGGGGGDFDSPLPQESFHAIHLASDNFSSFVFKFCQMHRPHHNHLPYH